MQDPTATPPVQDQAAAPPASDTLSTAAAEPAGKPASGGQPASDTPATGESEVGADAKAGVTPGAGPGTVAGPIPAVFAGGDGPGGAGADGGDGGQPQKKIREAVVYIPGLMHDAKFESIEAVGHRIARAMDNNDPDRAVSYSSATGENATYDGQTARTAVIRRKVGKEQETEVVDVYEFDYRPLLLNGFEKRMPLVQAWQIFVTLLSNTPNFVASTVRKGQTIPQKLQVGLAGVLGISMFLYIILLLATVVGTTRQVTREVGNDVPAAQAQQESETLQKAKADPWADMRQDSRGWRARVDRWGPPAVGGTLSTVATVLTFAWWLISWPFIYLWTLALHVWYARTDVLIWMQTAVVTISFGGMVFRWNLKEKLEQVSTETTCASGYLAYGTGRNEIVGRLARLLDHVGSRPDVTYRNVHLVGYSFGSVVALDSVYQDSEVNETFRQVTTLSTIGCPADFIRTYWMDYFVGRHQMEKPEKKVYWVNVYAPADVLSSNFVEGGTAGIGAGTGCSTEENDTPGTGVLMGSRKRARNPGRLSRARTDFMAWVRRRAGEMKNPPKPQVDGKDRLPDAHVQFGPPAPHGMVGWIFYILAGEGFKAHTCYWDRDPVGSAKTCWEPVMKRLYNYPDSIKGDAAAGVAAGAGAATAEAGGAA